MIQSYFGNGYKWGIDITYVEQTAVPERAAALLAEPFVVDTLSFSGGVIFLQPKPNTSACFRIFEGSHEGVMLLEPLKTPKTVQR